MAAPPPTAWQEMYWVKKHVKHSKSQERNLNKLGLSPEQRRRAQSYSRSDASPQHSRKYRSKTISKSGMHHEHKRSGTTNVWPNGLLDAVKHNDVESFLSIRESSADAGQMLRAVDGQGRTILHLACFHGHFEISSMLVSSGANVNCLDFKRKSPLHVICKYGHGSFMSVVMLLLAAGANPIQLDYQGHSPLYFAVRNKMIDVIKEFGFAGCPGASEAALALGYGQVSSDICQRQAQQIKLSNMCDGNDTPVSKPFTLAQHHPSSSSHSHVDDNDDDDILQFNQPDVPIASSTRLDNALKRESDEADELIDFDSSLEDAVPVNQSNLSALLNISSTTESSTSTSILKSSQEQERHVSLVTQSTNVLDSDETGAIPSIQITHSSSDNYDANHDEDDNHGVVDNHDEDDNVLE